MNPETIDSRMRLLCEDRPFGRINATQIKVLKHGRVAGAIVGGNLTLMLESVGIPYEVQTENKILFIEEISENKDTILDCLKALKNKGKLDGIKGVIFGRMTDCFQDEDEFVKSMKKVFTKMKYPILHNFPSGHTEDIARAHFTLPFGVPVLMDTKKRLVKVMEPAVNYMKTYDFALSCDFDVEEKFVRLLKENCKKKGLSFIWVREKNVKKVLK